MNTHKIREWLAAITLAVGVATYLVLWVTALTMAVL